MMTVTDVESSLALLHEPGEVFEIRILNTARAGTVSGYFDDFAAAASEIAKWDGKAPGVYTTLNPVDPALMARGANRLRERARDTTTDRDVLRRRWLLIDVDFHRPSGISATKDEVQAAGTVALRIQAHLEGALDWPSGILVMSGNGAHLLYRIEQSNDTRARDLLKRLLEKLAQQFNEDGGAEVDTTVHNAARIAKVPGTMACKGDNVPERPHRRSRVMEQPEDIQVVSLAALIAAAGPIPAPSPVASSRNRSVEFDVEEWMQRYGLAVRVHKTGGSGDLWELAVCPFNPEHDKGEAFVTRDASGSLLAGCHHNSCTWRWQDLREHFEPGYRERQSAWERGREEALAGATAAKEHGESTAAHVFLDWTTFWDDDTDEQEWAWRNVLAKGRGHAIYAMHKGGKSLLSLYMVAEMATTGGMSCLYLDYEMTRSDVRERLRDMEYGKATDLSHLYYALLPNLPALDTEEGGIALVEIVDRILSADPGRHLVVVIDTISRAVWGEENSADTWRLFYVHTGLRLKQRGVTWLRLDHGGKDSAKGQRGSSSKGDDVDVVWKLTATEGGVSLHRDLARMSWVPEKVSLLMQDFPLRYLPCKEDYPEGTAALANTIDRLSLPLDVTVRVAGTKLREIGEGRRHNIISAALKWRREKATEAIGGHSRAAGEQAGERGSLFPAGTAGEHGGNGGQPSYGNGGGNTGEQEPRRSGEQPPPSIGGWSTARPSEAIEMGDMP